MFGLFGAWRGNDKLKKSFSSVTRKATNFVHSDLDSERPQRYRKLTKSALQLGFKKWFVTKPKTVPGKESLSSCIDLQQSMTPDNKGTWHSLIKLNKPGIKSEELKLCFVQEQSKQDKHKLYQSDYRQRLDKSGNSRSLVSKKKLEQIKFVSIIILLAVTWETVSLPSVPR